VRVDVAFTPAETISAPVGIVVDVLRATSTIPQVLASGYDRVYCCAEVEDAVALRNELGTGLLGGERNAQKLEGFDVGASPREFAGEPRAETVIFSTTNGTRAILAAAGRCDEVLLGSLLNLGAVAGAARRNGGDVAVLCAGFQGGFALDDAYCAGRIVQLLEGERGDAAKTAQIVAGAFPDAHTALLARTYGPPGLEEDIAFCAQEDVLDVVPRFARMHGRAAEITASRANG
jgi:2-phosphosulfolactate phosphatase